MRRRYWIIFGALACLCTSAPGLAQEADSEDAQQAIELEEAEAAMEAAQRRLEEAAREVARLSAARVWPVGENMFVIRDFMTRRPLLGLNIEDGDGGVEVVGVTPSGPADEAGVEAGDLIVAIDGHELAGGDDATPTQLLMSQLALFEPGDVIALSLRRDGRDLGVDVETREFGPLVATGGRRVMDVPGGRNVRIFRSDGPGEPMRDFRILSRPFFAGRWGSMELVELTPALGEYFGVEEGLLVVRAPEDEELELVDGDVILTIGGRTPTSAGHAMRILGSFEPGEVLELEIMRQQRRQRISLELPAERSPGPRRIGNF